MRRVMGPDPFLFVEVPMNLDIDVADSETDRHHDSQLLLPVEGMGTTPEESRSCIQTYNPPLTIETRQLNRFTVSEIVFVDVDLMSAQLEIAFGSICNKRLLCRKYIRPKGWNWKRTVTNLAANHYPGMTFITAGATKGYLLASCLPTLYRLTDGIFHALESKEFNHVCKTHEGFDIYKCPCYIISVMMKKYVYFTVKGEDAWCRESNHDFICL